MTKKLVLLILLTVGAAGSVGAEELLIHNWTIATPAGRFGFQESYKTGFGNPIALPPGVERVTTKRLLFGRLGEVRTGMSASFVKTATAGLLGGMLAFLIFGFGGRLLRHRGSS